MEEMEGGGSVTLIFHRVQNFRNEHIINSLAALATRSHFAHVEIAIGNDSNQSNQITNVCRIFNDEIGAELTQRTGRNPSFVYLQLGCTKLQEQQMLRFARLQVGRPFSSAAMVRSVTTCPRRTTGSSYFCAGMLAHKNLPMDRSSTLYTSLASRVRRTRRCRPQRGRAFVPRFKPGKCNARIPLPPLLTSCRHDGKSIYAAMLGKPTGRRGWEWR